MRKFWACLLLLLLCWGAVPDRAAGYTAAWRSARPGFPEGPQAAIAGAAGQPGRVVIITVNRLRLNDIKPDRLPGFNRLLAQGAAALLNVNTAGSLSPENSAATIGAGAHLKADGSGATAYQAREKVDGASAGQMYAQRTGKTVPDRAAVQLDINALLEQNKLLPYANQPGALGQAVHRRGGLTAVLGNSDWGGSLQRSAVNLAMDERGVVDYGLIGRECLRPDPFFPGGYRTDYRYIMQQYRALPEQVHLVVIDAGDLSRLHEQARYIDQQRYQVLKQQAVQELDAFLQEMAGALRHSDLLLLVVPAPGEEGGRRDYLTPLLVYGDGVKPGWLSSPTTKRPGLVMSTDIAPTVLAFWGREALPGMTGRAMQLLPDGVDYHRLRQMYDQIALVYDARWPLLQTYAVFQVLLLLVTVGLIIFKWRRQEYIKPFLLAVMAVPLAFLLAGLLPQPDLLALAWEVLLITLLLTGLSLFVQRYHLLAPFLVICLLTALGILLDTWLGGRLQSVSVFSYDPVVGARFYGIGNEYMGVLLGALIAGSGAVLSLAATAAPFWQAALRLLCLPAFGLTMYTLAAPWLGTNVGGTIAALISLPLTVLLYYRVKMNWRAILALALLAGLFLGGFILYDLNRSVALQSHIGRAAGEVLAGGPGAVWQIVQRKTEVNIRLIKYTIWSRVFIASLGSLCLLFYRPVGVMKKIQLKYPQLFAAFAGVTAASIGALIFNDSGIVAAATAMIYAAPPMLYLILSERS